MILEHRPSHVWTEIDFRRNRFQGSTKDYLKRTRSKGIWGVHYKVEVVFTCCGRYSLHVRNKISTSSMRQSEVKIISVHRFPFTLTILSGVTPTSMNPDRYGYRISELQYEILATIFPSKVESEEEIRFSICQQLYNLANREGYRSL